MATVTNKELLTICSLTNAFPARSEMAILNQINGLISHGHQVTVFAEGRDPQASQLEKRVCEKIDVRQIPTRQLTRFSRRFFNRGNIAVRGIGQFLKTVLCAPAIAFKSINVFKRGPYSISFWLLYQVWPFVKTKEKHAYDIIHAQYGPNGTKAVLLREIGALSGKIVTSFRGYDLNRLPQSHDANIYDRLFQQGDLFTTDSDAMKKKLITLGCPEQRIRVIPSSVDLSYWTSLKPMPLENTVRFITAARLVPCKGIEYAIRAMQKVRKRGINARLTIAGDGPLGHELRNLVADLGLTTHVSFTGWVDQSMLKALFEEHHILLLPSIVSEDGDEESQGLVLQEAQAMGLKVIGSDIGGIREGLLEGKTGFTCKSADVEDLASKMQRLIEMKDDWPEMGIAARQFVSDHYSLEKQTDNLIKNYRNTLSTHSLAQ